MSSSTNVSSNAQRLRGYCQQQIASPWILLLFSFIVLEFCVTYCYNILEVSANFVSSVKKFLIRCCWSRRVTFHITFSSNVLEFSENFYSSVLEFSLIIIFLPCRFLKSGAFSSIWMQFSILSRFPNVVLAFRLETTIQSLIQKLWNKLWMYLGYDYYVLPQQ